MQTRTTPQSQGPSTGASTGQGAERSSTSGLKVQLKALDYGAQVQALTPRTPAAGQKPVQLEASTDPVQRVEGEGEVNEQPMPQTPEQAVELKDSGIEWANATIRKHYHTLTSGIAAANEGWIKEGVSAEERARRAFEIRHNARMTCRAMMGSRFEVIMLQIRDWWEYSSKDGPTFEYLVGKAKKQGLQGDAIYEEIIDSSGRKNKKIDKLNGIEGQGGGDGP